MDWKCRLLLTVLAVICAAPALALPIPAEPWADNGGGAEKDLWYIVDHFYLGGAYVAGALTPYGPSGPNDNKVLLEPYSVEPGDVFVGGTTVDVEAKYAAWRQTLGWYIQPDGPVTTKTPLLHVPATGEWMGIGTPGSKTVTFTSMQDFGFFLWTGPNATVDSASDPTTLTGTGTTWYSVNDLNAHGEDHMVLYDLHALLVDWHRSNASQYEGYYLMAWEDKPLTDASDRDYNDLVLLVKTTVVVPEPTSFLLVGLGLAGVVVRRMRSLIV